MDGSQAKTLQTEGPRPLQEQEWPRVVEFLNQNLRAGRNWSIEAEYPTAINKANRANMHVVIENGDIVSHALLRPMILKTPIGVFKVGAIGSVVTSTDHRGQGHSTKLIESCLAEAKAAGCDFAILWTDLFDFYRRMGFELAGGETNILIDREIPQPEATQEFKFIDSNRVAAEALLRVYNQHTVNSHRTLEDIRASLQIPNSRVSTAWDSNGRLVAYAIEGKGADLDGYIHEWGGAVTALTALVSHMRSVQKRDLRLIAPPHARNLIKTLTEAGCPRHDGNLGMIKILKTETLFTKIKRHARNLGHADLVLEERQGRWTFGKGTQTYSTDSETDLVRLLFGPEKPSQLHSFDAETRAALDLIFPIPVWVWGWDSV